MKYVRRQIFIKNHLFYLRLKFVDKAGYNIWMEKTYSSYEKARVAGIKKRKEVIKNNTGGGVKK